VRVWIEQHECVGNGICAEICPEVFELTDGDIGYVHDRGQRLPDGPEGSFPVPRELEQRVVEAADECPAECIYLEE